MLRRLLLGLLVLIVLVVAVFSIYVASRQNLKFDSTPYPDITASTDSAVIARGRYIVRSVAPCAACHSDPAAAAAFMTGAEVPLSGGFVFDIPPGKFHVRNITPDQTGIGGFSDKAVARALRYGVGNDGRALLPFMEMQGLSDEDLTAVISYLRSQPPVNNPVAMHEYNLLGKVVRATVLAKPVGPTAPPPATSPRGATLENGRYLTESVALCWACHTKRDDATGAMVGPRYAGTTGFIETPQDTVSWSPPNITKDPTTGRMARFTEDQFVARFRAGRVIPGSPMPWQSFQHMEEDDIRAIYRFLQTVPPVTNEVGPAMVKRERK